MNDNKKLSKDTFNLQATFTEVIRGIDGFKELEDLLEKAQSENKWVIHFGL